MKKLELKCKYIAISVLFVITIPPPGTFCQVFSALNFIALKQVFQLGYNCRLQIPNKNLRA